jgi:hypothetical protein
VRGVTVIGRAGDVESVKGMTRLRRFTRVITAGRGLNRSRFGEHSDWLQVKAILADFASLALVSPTAIPAATPGVALATTATGGVVRTRVYDTSTASRCASAALTGGQS